LWSEEKLLEEPKSAPTGLFGSAAVAGRRRGLGGDRFAIIILQNNLFINFKQNNVLTIV
jgi:hypothetical protein